MPSDRTILDPSMLSVTGSVDKPKDWEGQEVALTTNVEEWYEVADVQVR